MYNVRSRPPTMDAIPLTAVPYTCPRCDDTFALFGDLKRHLETNHSSDTQSLRDSHHAGVTLSLNRHTKELERRLELAKQVERDNRCRRYGPRNAASVTSHTFRDPSSQSEGERKRNYSVRRQESKYKSSESYPSPGSNAFGGGLENNPNIPGTFYPSQASGTVKDAKNKLHASLELQRSAMDRAKLGLRGLLEKQDPTDNRDDIWPETNDRDLLRYGEDTLYIQKLEREVRVKDELVSRTQEELMELARERSSLKHEAAELSNEKTETLDRVAKLEESFEELQQEKLVKERELDDLTTYLNATTEKEGEARQELEIFMEDLLARVSKAEVKVKKLKAEKKSWRSASMRLPTRDQEYPTIVQRSASALENRSRPDFVTLAGEDPSHSTPQCTHLVTYPQGRSNAGSAKPKTGSSQSNHWFEPVKTGSSQSNARSPTEYTEYDSMLKSPSNFPQQKDAFTHYTQTLQYGHRPSNTIDRHKHSATPVQYNRSQSKQRGRSALSSNKNLAYSQLPHSPQGQSGATNTLHSRRVPNEVQIPGQAVPDQHRLNENKLSAILNYVQQPQYGAGHVNPIAASTGLPQATPTGQSGSTDSGIGEGCQSNQQSEQPAIRQTCSHGEMPDMDSQGVLWEVSPVADPVYPHYYDNRIHAVHRPEDDQDVGSDYDPSYAEYSNMDGSPEPVYPPGYSSSGQLNNEKELLTHRLRAEYLIRTQQRELQEHLDQLTKETRELTATLTPRLTSHGSGVGPAPLDASPVVATSPQGIEGAIDTDTEVSEGQVFSERSSPVSARPVSSAGRQQEALYCIFVYLDTPTLGSIARVCRSWYRVSRHPTLWRTICLRRRRLSPRHLGTIAKWCTQVQAIVLEEIKPRKRKKNESKEKYASEIRGSLENNLEVLFHQNSGSLTSIRVAECGPLITERCIWLVSCHCRSLQRLVYISDTDPLGHEVLWALGAGCRDLHTLLVPPSYPSLHPEKFTNRCLQTIGRSWPHLGVLCVGGIAVDVKGLTAIAKLCMRLQVLELDHMCEVTREMAVAMCTAGLKGLMALEFTFTPVSAKALLQFNSSCPLLKKVAVHVGVSDYFEDTENEGNRRQFEATVEQLQHLKCEPGFHGILHVRTDYG